MSNEVKTKEKIDMDPKYLVKLALTLAITCVIVAGLLGLVNGITEGPITAINEQKTAEALSAVFQDAADPAFGEIAVSEEATAAAAAYGATVSNLYEVTSGGSGLGYAVKVVASGSQGNIEMVVGVDADMAITGISVVKNAETSGIGSKVMENNALPSGIGVLDQFIGMGHASGDLKVGSNVDAISGATVSSKGITKGANGALAAVEAMG